MNQDVEEIKRIVAPIAETHGVTRLYLFGSRAKGTDNADSDYDLAWNTSVEDVPGLKRQISGLLQ